ncbi:DUF4129 domain-containing protein [Paenibacillus hunanensis]|uniref:DUF4129 domain-containing protein n=1 Tax=Paenibacillus hunanensis TaxID=539262 RepID=UPI002A6B010F|nr:DUF4129 domain-containing protein [Paenibacillus hunanensis]WPP40242.1 DUF4129 domain-containing protein [Paenibacillus hunanensis]
MNEQRYIGNRVVAGILHIAMELAAIYPLIVLLDAYLLQNGLPWNWILLLLGIAGIGTLLRPAVRLNVWTNSILLIVYAVLILVGCYRIAATQPAVITWIAAVILGVVALLRGVMIARSDRDRLFPIRAQLIALGLTWIIYIAAGSSSSIHDVRGSLYAAGAFTLFTLLFRFTTQQIDYISLDEGFSFASLRAVIQRTRRWTWLAIVLIAILGASDQLTIWLERAWQALLSMLNNQTAPPPSMSTETYTPPPMEPLQLPETSNTGGDPFWVEKLAQLIVLLALCAFIGWIGYVVIRLIRRYAPKLYRWLLSLWEPQQLQEQEVHVDTYTDEVQKLAERSDQPRRLFQRNRKPAQLDERVRYYYRQLLNRADKRGIPIAVSATPEHVGRQLAPEEYRQATTTGINRAASAIEEHESIPGAGTKELIALYNRVRYDGAPVEEQELARWEQQYESGRKR